MRARAALPLAWIAGLGCFAWQPRPAPVEPPDRTVRIRNAGGPELLTLRRGDSTWTVTGVTAVYGRVTRVAGDTVELRVRRIDQSGAWQVMTAETRATVPLTPAHRLESYDLDGHATTVVVVTGMVALTTLWLISLLALSRVGD